MSDSSLFGFYQFTINKVTNAFQDGNSETMTIYHRENGNHYNRIHHYFDAARNFQI